MTVASTETRTMDATQLVEAYRLMVRERLFAEKVVEANLKGEMQTAYVQIGQEATSVGGAMAMRKKSDLPAEDTAIPDLMVNIGGVTLMDVDLKRVAAEFYGKETGYSKGKGGWMHHGSMEHNLIGLPAGIIGALIPIAAGMAMTAKIRKTDQVVLCFFGDGANNQGVFHEGLNLAAIQKLPVVYICVNNLYAISMPVWKSTAVQDIATRAIAYNIPGVVVDGMDVTKVYAAVKESVDRARRGEGPSLIECKTYRFRGHGEYDLQVYRSADEVEDWKRKCPIKRLRRQLMGERIASEEDCRKIEEAAAQEVEEAFEFARRSWFPEPEELYKDIYAD